MTPNRILQTTFSEPRAFQTPEMHENIGVYYKMKMKTNIKTKASKTGFCEGDPKSNPATWSINII